MNPAIKFLGALLTAALALEPAGATPYQFRAAATSLAVATTPATPSAGPGSVPGPVPAPPVSAPAAVLQTSHASLSFPMTSVGDFAADQAVTLTNTGTAAATLDGISVTSGDTDFSQSNTCGATLAVGAACTVTVRFTPSTVGLRGGTLDIAAEEKLAVRIELAGQGQFSTTNYRLQFNGAEGSTTITDSGTGTAWISHNGASLTASAYHEGPTSLNLDGRNQAVSGPAINLPGNFTISAWVRPTARPAGLAAIAGQWHQITGRGAWLFTTDNTGILTFHWGAHSENIAMLSVANALPLNTWTQIGVTRNGNTFTLYVNGAPVASKVSATAMAGADVPMSLGSYYTPGMALAAADYYPGQIDDFRMTVGTATDRF